jgi:hypothetical protein
MTDKSRFTSRHTGFCLTTLLSVAFCGAYAQARDMSVTDERPVAKAIEKLEQLYRVPITYEDTLYLNDNDIKDVTATVRLDHGTGDSAERVLVPARRSITFTLPEAQADAEPSAGHSEASLAAVKALLDRYTLAGGTGAFTVSEDSSGLHVVSRAFIDASGQRQTLKPALDAQISIMQPLQPALNVIEKICSLVSAGGGRTVDLGTIPTNLLATHLVKVDVKNVSAREILEDISKQVGMPLSWQLFCDPADGGCALNMHTVR